jgi:hypothetical protein
VSGYGDKLHDQGTVGEDLPGKGMPRFICFARCACMACACSSPRGVRWGLVQASSLFKRQLHIHALWAIGEVAVRREKGPMAIPAARAMDSFGHVVVALPVASEIEELVGGAPVLIHLPQAGRQPWPPVVGRVQQAEAVVKGIREESVRLIVLEET